MTTESVPGRANDRELGIADSTDSERNSITLGLALSQVRAAECLLHCAIDFPESSAGTDRVLIIQDMLQTALRALGDAPPDDDEILSVSVAVTDAFFASYGDKSPPVHWTIVKEIARLGIMAGLAMAHGGSQS